MSFAAGSSLGAPGAIQSDFSFREGKHELRLVALPGVGVGR